MLMRKHNLRSNTVRPHKHFRLTLDERERFSAVAGLPEFTRLTAWVGFHKIQVVVEMRDKLLRECLLLGNFELYEV